MTGELVNLRAVRTDPEGDLPPEATVVAITDAGVPPMRWEAECSACGLTFKSASSVVVSELGSDGIPTGLSVVKWWENEDLNPENVLVAEELLSNLRRVHAVHVATPPTDQLRGCGWEPTT